MLDALSLINGCLWYHLESQQLALVNYQVDRAKFAIANFNVRVLVFELSILLDVGNLRCRLFYFCLLLDWLSFFWLLSRAHRSRACRHELLKVGLLTAFATFRRFVLG